MSNVSIFEKKWIDLVFEGKNKAYGAYQLRQQSPRTTLFAFFFGITFLSALIFTLSSFSKSPLPPAPTEFGTKIILDGGYNPPKNKPKKIETKTGNNEIKDDIKKEDLRNAVITKENEKHTDVKTNAELKNTGSTDPGSAEGAGTGTPGTGEGTGGGGGGDTGGGAVLPPNNDINLAPLLDKQPEFPGGIKKFYEYVGRNFDKPNIDEMESVSVNVSFVIEKDGSMTDIKVLRNPGYGLDKEAIRVLKSLRTKWTPGVKNGQYVRTQYTLPIRIQLN